MVIQEHHYDRCADLHRQAEYPAAGQSGCRAGLPQVAGEAMGSLSRHVAGPDDGGGRNLNQRWTSRPHDPSPLPITAHRLPPHSTAHPRDGKACARPGGGRRRGLRRLDPTPTPSHHSSLPPIKQTTGDRQTTSFIEISIEAGILLGGKHEACFVLGVAGIEPMPS
jgi:hypothetical protein